MRGEHARRAWTTFAVVLVVAALLRLPVVMHPGLWCDEIFSLAMATGHSLEHPATAADAARGDYVEPDGAEPARSFRRYVEPEAPPAGGAGVIQAVRRSDTSPPFYYLALSWWLRVAGTSDAALRLFSLACALAAMPLLWSIGRDLGGTRVAAIACTAFALAPPAVYYSTEGRMYALTWLLGLWLARLTLSLARRGPYPSAVVGWVVAGAAGLLTHYFVGFVWFATVLWLLVYGGDRLRRWTVIAMVAAVAVLIAPWYAQVPDALRAWRVTGDWLDTPLSAGQLAYGVFRLGGSLVNGYGVWRGVLLTMPVQLVLLAVLAASVVRSGARPLLTRDRQLVLLWLAASVLGPVLLDVVRHTAMSRIERYALPGLPAAMLVFALAVDHVFRPVGIAVLVGTVLAWLPGIREVAKSSPRYWEPFPTVATELADWTDARDLVIVHSIPSGVIGVARYIDPATPIASWVVQLGARTIPDAAAALVAGRCRVAVVRTHDLGSGQSALDAWLREHATVGRTLTLYEDAGVRTTITEFTRDEPDGRCAHRSSPPRTRAANDSGTPSPPAPRSGG
jgi:hypothetical protein